MLAFSEGARVQARTPYRMPPHQPAWIPGRAARGVRALIAGRAFSGPKGQPSPQPGPSALESTGVRKGKAWKAGRSVPAQRSSGNELLARWAARSSGRRYQGRWPWLEERIALRADVPMPLASASEKSRQGRPKIAHRENQPLAGPSAATPEESRRRGLTARFGIFAGWCGGIRHGLRVWTSAPSDISRRAKASGGQRGFSPLHPLTRVTPGPGDGATFGLSSASTPYNDFSTTEPSPGTRACNRQPGIRKQSALTVPKIATPHRGTAAITSDVANKATDCR